MSKCPETHRRGTISIENIPEDLYHQYIKGNYNAAHLTGDLGIKVARDGRIWVCINGVSYLRFKPNTKE